jgi:hypothetical protein
MEQKYEFTHSEIQQAFELWNADYLANPDEFEDTTKDSAPRQTEYLLKYLKEVQEG